MNGISVALVEDKVDFCLTVRDFLLLEPGFRLCGMAHNEEDFQDLLSKTRPDVALIDIGLTRPDGGMEILRWIQEKRLPVKPVILTVIEEEVLECYALGARGYLLKTRLEELGDVVRRVHGGQLVVPSDTAEVLVYQAAHDRRLWQKRLALERLSDREVEILRDLKAGIPREEIARRRNISFFTVRRHIQKMMERCGTHSVKMLLEKFGEVL